MRKKDSLSSEILVYGLLIMIVGAVVVIGLNYISSQKNVDKSGAASTAINKNGVTVLKSSDGSALVIISAGTVTSTKEISIKSVENPVIDSKKRASEIYQLGPAGTTFSNPVEIRIRYDPKIVGDCPSLINFYHYNEDGTLKEYVASKKIYCGSYIAAFDIDSFSFGYAGKAVRDEEAECNGNCNLITGNAASITGFATAPNRINEVISVNTENRGLIRDGHAFTDAVACRLWGQDPKWGRNGKRGNVNDPSSDAIAYQGTDGPGGVDIIDIISSSCDRPDSTDCNPQPAWQDVTQRYPGGALGAWIQPRCNRTPPPPPSTNPNTQPSPSPTPASSPASPTTVSCSFNSKLEGFDSNKFPNSQTPKYKAARVFACYSTPRLTLNVIAQLNAAGLQATQVEGSRDVINFDIEYEPGKKVGRVDVIRAADGADGSGAAWQWLPVEGGSATASTTQTSTNNCNDLTGTLPQVDSLSAATLSTGGTLTINGKFLTRTVQFYGDNGRNSYIGAVNSDCSSATINVPSDLPSGTYTVKIYKARDKISNGKMITITSGGGGSGTGRGCQTSNNGVYPTLTYPSCIDEMDDPRSIRSARAKEDVGIFTVCRDVVWMIRNTNSALACSSDFTYRGIPAATWKIWVEKDAKTLDDACIGVCHPGVDCERQPNSVDKDKLIQALENYLKNCIQRKGISCICNPDPADPVCGQFVQYMGGINIGTGNNCNPNNPLSPTAVSFSWSPKLTNNGWFPQISPDGRYVTYGFGENWVVDLQTGQERSFTIAASQSFAGQWIKPDTLTFVNFISQRDNTAERYEVKVREWIARKTNDNPILVAGNTFVAADGHWASWIADARNNYFRIAYDNSILATNVYGLAMGNDNWLAFAADNDHSALKVWHNGAVAATYTPQIPLQQWAVNRGYVLYGGYGSVHGITPNGQDIDLTATPWKWENIGGVVFVDDKPWVYTASWDNANNKGYILIRPWGEKASVAIEISSVSVHIVYANNEFIVASNDDKGKLTVARIPANAQRVDLSNPGAGATQPTKTPTISGSGVSGSSLSFFSQNRFFVFISYFDAINAPDQVLDSDFAYLKSKGIDGIRIFPNWWKNGVGGDYASDTLMDGNGNLRPEPLARLKKVMDKAQASGLVVDVTFARETVDGLSVENYKKGIQTAVDNIAGYPNIIVDLQNEWNVDRSRFPEKDIRSTRDAIKQKHPNVLLAASTSTDTKEAVDFTTRNNLDIVAFHDLAISNWYRVTSQNVQNLKPASKPIYFQEPGRIKSDLSYTADNFITGVTGAKSGGAAAWTFHTKAGFNLRSQSLQSQLENAEKEFLNSPELQSLK